MQKASNPTAAQMRTRKKFLAANWKMNKINEDAAEYFRDFLTLVKPSDLKKTDLALCVPYTALETAVTWLSGTGIYAGAQNMHYEDKGAYTGEISASMLSELGAQCVILGHSERRQYFGETDAGVSIKVHKALERNMLPIICVGETLSEKESGLTSKVVKIHTVSALDGVLAEDLERLVLAYEPVWAIGTGKTATAEDANEVIRQIRGIVEKLYDKDAAEKVRIVYGGSMNAKNAHELLSMSDIDGGLVGTAGLKPEDFYAIVKCI